MAKYAIPKKVTDLKGASYNPRTITPNQLKKLRESIEKYGDLSGMVFNRASGVLIAGHQRAKTIKNKKHKFEVSRSTTPDAQGTIAVGAILVTEDDGSTTRIPYREVHWDDKLAEMAANVNANAAGGEWDQAKLGAIMAKLEKGQFDIESVAVDAWTTAKAIGKFKKTRDEGNESESNRDSDSDEAFDVIDPSAMRFAHTCPKCSYQWGDAEKPNKSASVKEVVSKSHRPTTKKAKTK
jgi:hypothetical protein